MPLSCGGLWLAVIMMPALAPHWRTENESCGVERSAGKSSAPMPRSLSAARGDEAESLREKPHIVRNDDAVLLARIVFQQIGTERGDGAVDVAAVEHVGARAGKLSRLARGGAALLGLGDDLAHGAAAHAAGAEGDVAVKAVVEFGPGLRREQFVDRGAVVRCGGRLVDAGEVRLRGGEEFRAGFVGEIQGCGGHAGTIAAPRRETIAQGLRLGFMGAAAYGRRCRPNGGRSAAE